MKTEVCTHTPTDCDKCVSKANNPICSIHGALDLVKKTRSDVHFKSGQTIFYAGNEPLGIFNVQSGLVKLETLTSDGHAYTLRLLGPGAILGHRSFFSKTKHHASAVAVEDTRLCFIPAGTLKQIQQETPEALVNIIADMAKDLQSADEKWVDQIEKHASERIAEALLFLNDHFKNVTWTRKEIAEWAGTTTETVIRTLAQFEKEGWIDQAGRGLVLVKREKIAEKAGRL